MAQLDIKTLLNSMLGAVKTSLASKWPGVQDIATTTFKSLAQNMVDIQAMKQKGTISNEKAALLVDMQKNAIKIALLSEEGLGLLAVEAAINAALGAVGTTVNAALGFTLI